MNQAAARPCRFARSAEGSRRLDDLQKRSLQSSPGPGRDLDLARCRNDSRHHAQHAPARDVDRQCAHGRHGSERPGPKSHSTGAAGCQRRRRRWSGAAARARAAVGARRHAQCASGRPGAATDGGAAHGRRATLELGLAAIRLDGRPARRGDADDAGYFGGQAVPMPGTTLNSIGGA